MKKIKILFTFIIAYIFLYGVTNTAIAYTPITPDIIIEKRTTPKKQTVQTFNNGTRQLESGIIVEKKSSGEKQNIQQSNNNFAIKS